MIIRYIFFVLYLALAGNAIAQETMMSEISYPYLEKLVAAAKINYPKAKTFQNKVNIAEINVHKAKLDWFSILNFAYIYSPTNSVSLVNPVLNGYQLAIYTSVGNILQRPGAIKSAKQDYEIAVLNQQEYDMNLETIVKTRYFAYVQQLTLLNWKLKSLGNAESVVNQMKYKFEKGEETYENYNRALSVYSNSVQTKIEAEGGLLTAKINLEEIIGAKLESIK